MFLHLSSTLEWDKSVVSITLPTVITFDSPHEVAIVDASITNSWANSPYSGNAVVLNNSVVQVEAYFPAQFYENAASVGKALIEMFKTAGMEEMFLIPTALRSNTTVLNLEILPGGSLNMHSVLKTFLGFEESLPLHNTDRHKMVVKLKPNVEERFSRIFLTSDLVESTVPYTLLRLQRILASIPVKHDHGELCTFTGTPIYLPLNSNRLERVKIRFFDERGRGLKLLFGGSYVLLHIRPIKS